jgi:hypothetical protein
MNSTETIHDMLPKYFARRRVQGRHVSEITAIASKFGNSAKIIVPRSWLRKRVIAFLHSEYIAKHPEEPKSIEQ